LGVRLYGDETFEELMQIKETGVHPRGEPPLKKADGGRVAFALGGGSIVGEEDDDEFAAIQGQTAGLGVLSGLNKIFGPKIGQVIFNRGKKKVAENLIEKARQLDLEKKAKQSTAAMAAANRAAGRGGYQSSFGRDEGFMGGRGTAAEMGSFADGGLVTLFTEKR
jgi:hypothetical protein